MKYEEVLEFWFEQLSPQQWFSVDEGLDKLISQRFSALLEQATQCELFSWRESAEGSLAEVIVLDQFSRNVYRGSSKAFASDSLALALAQHAVSNGQDQQLASSQRSFLYMPYMHSESLLVHQQAQCLFNQTGLEQSYQFELKHKVIIEQFGRYPHRNKILGRESSQAELDFLAGPNSSF
ncbi:MULTISPECIES: DUF924 family protein [unclassified Agarivorans]|uniref:DUF924 family protein n=1 Tax=unclassified Agarivorans TaxID=2636026 RepID=UPI0026E2B798|nr:MULTISPECIES: DUF924 family protein [unclassified Agarivorans]MDO6684322.1 DUF924 family protein [Agarivorans sp. 3_MG-2023]MDO6714487.1 DUF924 family protein [Agarivorans sp. 2_MG-2023]